MVLGVRPAKAAPVDSVEEEASRVAKLFREISAVYRVRPGLPPAPQLKTMPLMLTPVNGAAGTSGAKAQVTVETAPA